MSQKIGKNMKIYCVFFDTMPLLKELIEFAEDKNMQLLLQIGNCFTMTSLMSMFTRKMPSDLLKNGIGNRSFEQYRNKKSKNIYLPWVDEYITSKLSKKKWQIKIHNLPPTNYIHGDINTDSCKGGYKARYIEYKNNKKKIFWNPLMGDLLLGNSTKSYQWYNREYEFIKSISNKISDKNIFYFIEYEHYHSLTEYINKKNKNKMTEIKNETNKRVINLMSQWNFDEPNSIFWFFSDHGWPHECKKIPNANSYLSWVLFKDNINSSINPKSKIISIRDFSPTIFKKFNYDYESTSESMSIDEINDKNRVYFVEDGRSRVDRKKSTSVVCCMVIKWKNNSPIEIIQVGYFKPKKIFIYCLNVLDKNGFFKKYIKIDINDKKYRNRLLYLKEKLKNRFKWIG